MKTRPRQAGTPGANLRELLEHAIAHVRHGRRAEADQALQAILKHWPEQPDALHFLGVLRHDQGRSAEAIALVRRALEQMPEHAPTWSNLGNILLSSGQVDAACAYLVDHIEAVRKDLHRLLNPTPPSKRPPRRNTPA